jgi:sulfite exporter TauE/SafE
LALWNRLGKGFKIPIGNKMLNRGTEGIFLFGFLMGVAPCVPYVAILTYIACVAENAVLAGMWYATAFALGTAIAPIALGAFMGFIESFLFFSDFNLYIMYYMCLYKLKGF